jgi:5'-3' exonuclease
MKSSMDRSATWLIIDGNNWFCQCDFGSMGRGVETFLRRLNGVRQALAHAACFVCWDSPKSWRSELSPTYKAHRPDKPADFVQRLTTCRERVRSLLGQQSIQVDGYEADDCMGTLAAWAKGESVPAILFSSDRYLHQCLVGGQVTQVISVKRRDQTSITFGTVTAGDLLKNYGVQPHQWVDYRCLVGDKSDGLAGCPGVGPDSAKAVLQRCGTLERYYSSPKEQWQVPLTNKQRTALNNYREALPLQWKLMKVCSSVPLPASIVEVNRDAAGSL